MPIYVPPVDRLTELRHTLDALNRVKEVNAVHRTIHPEGGIAADLRSQIDDAISGTLKAISAEVRGIVLSRVVPVQHQHAPNSDSPPPQPPPITRGKLRPERGLFSEIVDLFKWMSRNPPTGPR